MINIEVKAKNMNGRDREAYRMITKETSINELLRSHPLVREVFAKHGMGCIGCMGAATETIENGAKMHNISVEALLKELNELCNRK